MLDPNIAFSGLPRCAKECNVAVKECQQLVKLTAACLEQLRTNSLVHQLHFCELLDAGSPANIKACKQSNSGLSESQRDANRTDRASALVNCAKWGTICLSKCN
jgi:hypothetical protein